MEHRVYLYSLDGQKTHKIIQRGKKIQDKAILYNKITHTHTIKNMVQ